MIIFSSQNHINDVSRRPTSPLTQQGYNGLQQFPYKVGKDRQRSEIKKWFRMPSGKRRVHSVGGRHNDDR